MVREIELELTRALGNREFEKPALPLVRAHTLQQLIRRELILQRLTNRKQAATEADIELAITRLTRQLSRQEIPLTDYLKKRQMSRADLQRALRWQLSWEEFLRHYVTDDNLESFFRDRRAEYDGTQLRVAHILLSVDDDKDKRIRNEELARKQTFAKELRQRIVSGELTFTEAARLHSNAPTASSGGEIGLISRHAPMPESFSAAAYGLSPRGISEPVTTAFGIHLIRCLEVQPGNKNWQDVRDELEPAIARYLFEWAAGQELPRAQIEFTGNSPHLEPGTDRIIGDTDAH